MHFAYGGLWSITQKKQTVKHTFETGNMLSVKIWLFRTKFFWKKNHEVFKYIYVVLFIVVLKNDALPNRKSTLWQKAF